MYRPEPIENLGSDIVMSRLLFSIRNHPDIVWYISSGFRIGYSLKPGPDEWCTVVRTICSMQQPGGKFRMSRRGSIYYSGNNVWVRALGQISIEMTTAIIYGIHTG